MSGPLRIKVNGGAPQSGNVVAVDGDTIQLTASSMAGWDSSDPARWEILDYADGFTLPSGWTEDATTHAFYYLGNADPPSFMPVEGGHYVTNLYYTIAGTRTVDESTGLSVPDAAGYALPGAFEGDRFGNVRERWVRSFKTVLALLYTMAVVAGTVSTAIVSTVGAVMLRLFAADPGSDPASGLSLWLVTGQLRSRSIRGVRQELNCLDGATGATSKRILSRIGRASISTATTTTVLTIPAADLPSGDYAASIAIRWGAFDTTPAAGSRKSAGGNLQATIRRDNGTTVVMTTAANQVVGVADNDTAGVDTAGTLPAIAQSSGDIIMRITTTNTNAVKAFAKCTEFTVIEH